MKTPFIIAFFRILLAPILFYSIILEFYEIAIALYVLGFLSDIVDGMLASKMIITSSSTLEAYIDPLADFVLVVAAFFAFSFLMIYPIWLLILLIGMFVFFIISSDVEKPQYDPIGKYYGTYLFITIGITLLFPIQMVYDMMLFSILIYTFILFVYRTKFFLQSQNQNVSKDK